MIFRLVVTFLYWFRSSLASLLWIGPLYLSKTLRERMHFELSKLHSESFKKDGTIAFVAFEVSSEGELEQARPLIDYYLSSGKKVEIIYSSASVEKKCVHLATSFPTQIRLLRLPLLVFWRSVSSWGTANHLILCRYDFYPQLLLYGMKKNRKFSLISATLKNKKIGWYRRKLYQTFNFVVAATKGDEKRIAPLNTNVSTYDFRVVQIMNRVNAFDSKWKALSFSAVFEKLYSEVIKSNRHILGSCWPSEMDIFSNQSFCQKIREGKLFVVLAPHKLNATFLGEIRKAFKKSSVGELEIYHIGPESTHEDITNIFDAYSKKRGIFMVTIPGILCEFYTHFGYAYVGGGFGRSIHSVLEPYLAGASVICGPKTYRSTEYDLILESSPHLLRRIDNLHDYFSEVEKSSSFRMICEKRGELIDKAQQLFHNIVVQLGGETDA